jgi:hypothetical protein
MNRKEQLEEYAKCLADPVYAIETYLETFDQTQSGYVPFHLFPKQKELVHSVFDNRFTIVTKPRQAGITTTTAACMAIKVSFYGDEEMPEKILILANRQEIAQEFLKKIKEFLEQVPRWVWGIEFVQDPKKTIFLTDSKKHIILPTKCEIKALATSKDALRGFTPTTLVMDEAAYIENGAEVYGAALPSLGTGGKSVLISTPNGYDDLYYKIYDGAVNKKNKYNVVEMRWYQDLRYNKNLKWIKGEQLIPEELFTLESYKKMIDQRLHYDDPKSKVLSTRKDLGKYKKFDNKVPGFNVGANRLNMVAEFERCVRQNELIIRSSRLISEMKTFVYRNGRPDHMEGYHDDLLMGMAMCLWILQTSFKNLEKVNEQTKALLNSWVVSSPTNGIPTNTNTNNNQKQVVKTPPPNIPNGDFMWLLGGM